MDETSPFPSRKYFDHSIPTWVDDNAVFFITICCTPRHKNQLCHEPVYKEMAQALSFYESRGKLFCLLFLAMPDHIHMLLHFAPETSMSRIIGGWKRQVAKTQGITWQRGYFDHRIRKDESLDEKAQYIRFNPIRAELIETIDEWPYYFEKEGVEWR